MDSVGALRMPLQVDPTEGHTCWMWLKARDIRKNRTRELCIMSHNEGLYPIIPRYISPFLIRKQLAALAAALAAAHYSLRIPSIHAIRIDLIHYSMYCKDVLQTKYIQPNGM